MIRKKIFEISGRTDTNNDSSKNTNVKSEINKVNTNKRCQFLENIVPINETSEQNSNGYCNVDFVFMLNQTNASFICGIKVIFSIMNLYLFLKYMPSDFKSLSSLWCDMRSICYLLCNNMHSYRSGKWHRKCKRYALTSILATLLSLPCEWWFRSQYKQLLEKHSHHVLQPLIPYVWIHPHRTLDVYWPVRKIQVAHRESMNLK